jgi:hypothetical protein
MFENVPSLCRSSHAEDGHFTKANLLVVITKTTTFLQGGDGWGGITMAREKISRKRQKAGSRKGLRKGDQRDGWDGSRWLRLASHQGQSVLPKVMWLSSSRNKWRLVKAAW